MLIKQSIDLKPLMFLTILLGLLGCGEPQISELSEPFPAFRSGPYGMEFSFIPRGHFRMGSPESEEGRSDDENLHWVELTTDYWVQRTEVTRGQWFAVMGYYPKVCGPVMERNNYPVTCVKRNEIENFIRKLNRLVKNEGYTYRLPTEAQWEYAARAYTETTYSVEGLLDSFAWYRNNSKNQLHPVAQLKANNFGLYDVHGNVSEWVSDGHGEYPESEFYEDAVKDPKGSEYSKWGIVRGGARYHNELGCRLARRDEFLLSAKDSNFGFRLLRTAL